ncbi:MAG: MFS transporter [Planctomycetota bacterium]|nr:MAG: MFS transporter [Planctomycetota bacterium]
MSDQLANDSSSAPSGVKFKLSVMMFLEFFIWGSWLPVSFGYFGDAGLKFTPGEQSLVSICFPLSAILAMFFTNAFVDRTFAAEKFLALSHFIGGLALLGMGQVTSFQGMLGLMALHCLFYVPTISITNAIAFANLKDAQKEFGPVRLWGTIGWIAAAWPFIFILVDWAKVPAMAEAGGFVKWLGTAFQTSLVGEALIKKEAMAFTVAGVASILMAVFSLMLPHTPPKPVTIGQESSAGLGALKHLATPFILVLFVVTWIDSTVHDGFFFFAFTYLAKVGVPSNWVQTAMSVGQIAEIGTMAFLAPVLATLGWRKTMVIGILGHAARFAVFALVPNPYCAVAVNVLHGVCYAFFFATLYIFIDEFLPKDSRTSAQGLFNFLVLGMGPITARYLWPYLQDIYTVKGEVVYSKLLLFPSGIAIVGAVLLLLFFHPPKNKAESTGDVVLPH